MKNYVISFLKRGMVGAVGGPVILAFIYYILGQNGIIESLSVNDAVKGILTSALLAFVASGISMIYTVDKLQLGHASLIQCAVLYIDYLAVYLVNGWISFDAPTIIGFTVIFMLVFILIWSIIYLVIKRNISAVNRKLSAK